MDEEKDLLSMWIDGKHNELFATLEAMTFKDRIVEIWRLCRAMADFDQCNSEPDCPTEELSQFLDECMARLSQLQQ